jgi:hypothetical protein
MAARSEHQPARSPNTGGRFDGSQQLPEKLRDLAVPHLLLHPIQTQESVPEIQESRMGVESGQGAGCRTAPSRYVCPCSACLIPNLPYSTWGLLEDSIPQ